MRPFLMSYIKGEDRGQAALLPAEIENYLAADSLVQVIGAFADGLDFRGGPVRPVSGGLDWAAPLRSARPADALPVRLPEMRCAYRAGWRRRKSGKPLISQPPG